MEPSTRPILVIEDDDDIRETIRDVLQDEGYRVDTAANGREAIDHLQDGHLPAVILLDLMMPVMNGAEFLDELSADPRLVTIPVIVVSAWPRHSGRVGGHSTAYVRKPIDLRELLGQIERLGGGRLAH